MTDKHFVPSKKTLALLGLVVLGLAAYGGYYFWKNKSNNNKKNDAQIAQKKVKVALVDDEAINERFLDTDNDGAYDWVEELYPELDPRNPDSDGDGVLDGVYIEQLKQIKDRERSLEDDSIKELSVSEKLGRGIYTALYAIQQSGGDLDEETEKKISENVADYIGNLSLGSKLYIRNDLDLVPNSKKNSYAYRDAMLNFYKNNTINTSDFILLSKASNDPENFRVELEAALLKYTNYIEELSKMKVPYVIAGRHTELMNTVGQIEGSLKNLMKEEVDEVVALSSLVQMEKTFTKVLDVNVRIQKYFEIIEDESLFNEVPEGIFIEDKNATE